MSDTIKIRITAAQKVHYNQVVEMPLDRWEQMKGMDEYSVRQLIEGYLDLSNVANEDGIEDDFEAFVVDNQGKVIKPRDGYGY